MKKLKLCPKCGESLVPYVGFQAGMIYDCKNCGYHGPLTINVNKSDENKIRMRLREKR